MHDILLSLFSYLFIPASTILLLDHTEILHLEKTNRIINTIKNH